MKTKVQKTVFIDKQLLQLVERELEVAQRQQPKTTLNDFVEVALAKLCKGIYDARVAVARSRRPWYQRWRR